MSPKYKLRRARQALAKRHQSLLQDKDSATSWAGQFWTFAKTVTATAAFVSVATIGYTLWSTSGKFVVLPFEIRGQARENSELSNDISGAIAESINDVANLFSQVKRSKEEFDAFNYADLIPLYLQKIPLTVIPSFSYVQQSIAFSKITVKGVDIPIGRWIFENFSFFHRDYISGTLEIWNGDLVARVFIRGKQSFILTADSAKSMRWLVDMIVAEISNREHWVDVPRVKSPALMYFTRGFLSYVRYSESADKSDLESAKNYYKNAIDIDHEFRIARMHYAITKYISWTKEDLYDAIQNFSYLIGDNSLEDRPRVGYIASILRYLDRANDCVNYNSYIDRAKQALTEQIGSRKELSVEELVLRAGIKWKTLNVRTNNHECRNADNISPFDIKEINDGYDSIMVDYNHAIEKLLTRRGSGFRVALLRIRKRTVLDDKSNALMRVNKFDDAKSALLESIQLANAMTGELEAIPRWHLNDTMPFYLQSIANTHLRVAYAKTKLHEKTDEHIKRAKELLTRALLESSGNVEEWTGLKLAELLFSSGDVVGAGEIFFKLIEGSSHTVLFDHNALYEAGIILGKREKTCDLIVNLTSLVDRDPSMLLPRIILSEIAARAGLARRAFDTFKEAMFAYNNNFLWYGDVIELKLELNKLRHAEKNANYVSRRSMPGESIERILVKGKNTDKVTFKQPNTIVFDIMELSKLFPRNSTLRAVAFVSHSASPELAALSKDLLKKPTISCGDTFN
jgi:tetratricopeptide (TPR) repeat protein